MERAPAATASASWSEKATRVERSVVMGSFICEWWREARREGWVGRRPGGIGRMARWLRRSHREARRAVAIPLGEGHVRAADDRLEALGDPLPAFLLQVGDVPGDELADGAVVGDFERREVLPGDAVGVERHHRALIETVEGEGGIAGEEPDVSGLPVLPRQPAEIPVGVDHHAGDLRPVVEVLAEREHQLVVLEVGEEDFERRAVALQEFANGGVVVLAPAPRMDEENQHRGRGLDQLLEPLNEAVEGPDPDDSVRGVGGGAHRRALPYILGSSAVGPYDPGSGMSFIRRYTPSWARWWTMWLSAMLRITTARGMLISFWPPRLSVHRTMKSASEVWAMASRHAWTPSSKSRSVCSRVVK